MATLDIFGNNAFQLAQLTNAIETAPYKPRMLGELGLFTQRPTWSLIAWIEKRQNKLAVLHTANRGTMHDVRSSMPRTAIPFKIPHVPYFQDIIADDIQGIRAFGKETELVTMARYVNEQLKGMKQDHEVTHEYHRIGALKGVVYDADGVSVIHNFFTAFGLSQTIMNWYQNDTSLANHFTSIVRTMANKLGNEGFTKIVALCGDTYFDQLTQHNTLLTAYDRWRDGEFKRVSHLGPQWMAAASANGFEYQDILFINYRGKIGDLAFIENDSAYFVPLGIPDLFQEVFGPADFMETVNTLGRKFYAKQERLPFDKGVKLHTQSNTLAVCTRPDVIIKDVYNEGSATSSSV